MESIKKLYTPEKIKKAVDSSEFKLAKKLLNKIRGTNAYKTADKKIDLIRDTKSGKVIEDNLKEYAKQNKVAMTEQNIKDYMIIFNGIRDSHETARRNAELQQFLMTQQMINEQFNQQMIYNNQQLMTQQINTPGMF